MKRSIHKHVLIISFYYPPNPQIGARRISKISKGLIEIGWIPHIITAKYTGTGNQAPIEIPKQYVHHVDWFDIKKYRDSFRKKGFFGLLYAKFLGFIPNRVFQKKFPDIDKYLWRRNAIKVARKLIDNQNIDLIYSSYGPISSIIIANKLAIKFNIPWISEYRDLWTRNPYDENLKIIRNLNMYYEKKYISKANSLVTVSEPLKNDLILLHNKPTSVIYNGYDKLDQVGNLHNPRDGKFKIVYTGALYAGRRDPTFLFKALKILKKTNYKFFKMIQVEFYGPNNIDIVKPLVKKYRLEDIVLLHNQISHEEVVKKQKEADMLLLLGWNNKKDAGVVTGKLFEYMERRKKILAIAYPKGVINQILNETGLGKVVVDKHEIAVFLTSHIEHVMISSCRVNTYGNDLSLEPYSRANQVRRLSVIFNNILN